MADSIRYYTDGNAFCIDDYNNAKPFASFFPGIAGLWGKPMWVFYVNRGQAIAGFGTRDKDGAILEFLPANKAWRYTTQQGFRTFIKPADLNAPIIYEPFSYASPAVPTMRITTGALELHETNDELGLTCRVTYFQLPGEPVPALVRVLSLRNETDAPIEFECLDGMPAVTPYGLNDYMQKNISRLGEGWFSGVEFTSRYGLPCYKLQVQPVDRPDFIEITNANFYVGWCTGNNTDIGPVTYVVDPEHVFGNTTDFTFPTGFAQNDQVDIPGLTAPNKTAAAFGHFRHRLYPGMTCTYYSLAGMVSDSSRLDRFFDEWRSTGFIERKQEENDCLTTRISDDIATCSADPVFDTYCRQTYIDNLLRGGYPVTFGSDVPARCLYVFSRIHGDMEREYNNFVIEPHYVSQGNGNFRDVCQNRRNDVFFNPDSGPSALVSFANLLQLDGYNPLRILGTEFTAGNVEEILRAFPADARDTVKNILSQPFRPGSFFTELEDAGISIPEPRDAFLATLITASDAREHAEPGEGYWTDHWHYITDLFESYAGIFPDKTADILLYDTSFSFYDSHRVVMPRSEKYVLFNDEPRQLDAVYDDQNKAAAVSARSEAPHLVRTAYGSGPVYKTSLLAKFLCLIANKFASLDPEGMGIEYEAEKPGWCDALNGIPGLFGSSLCETLALKRLLNTVRAALDASSVPGDETLIVADEVAALLASLYDITRKETDRFSFWDAAHTAREKYLEQTRCGVSGEECQLNIERIREILNAFSAKIDDGIDRAFDPDTGVIRSCFVFIPSSYDTLAVNGDVKRNWNGRVCIQVHAFSCRPLPLFLEGPVHYLRIADAEQAGKLHANVCSSRLYDEKLRMFKLNEPLDAAPLEIGRIKIFTPGWLENESIWMHMEHKYLLELLKQGLVEAFYDAVETCGVWNMDPAVYGRSTFENVSFIVSSGHPEASCHGRGFVSRLSGVTAEFISIWRAVTTGIAPFSIENGTLILTLRPLLKGTMFTSRETTVSLKGATITVPEHAFLCMFLGSIPLRYHNPNHHDTFGPDGAAVARLVLQYPDGSRVECDGNSVTGKRAHDVRSRNVSCIDAFID